MQAAKAAIADRRSVISKQALSRPSIRRPAIRRPGRR
jgi:hypothetical protein